MDQRIESFLADVLALAGEDPDAVQVPPRRYPPPVHPRWGLDHAVQGREASRLDARRARQGFLRAKPTARRKKASVPI
jgi:hypothetical protein